MSSLEFEIARTSFEWRDTFDGSRPKRFASDYIITSFETSYALLASRFFNM